MRRAVVPLSILAAAWYASQAAALDGAAVAEPSPYLACRGSAVIPAATWAHAQVLTATWADLDLSHARVLRRLFWSITHNDMLEEHAADCGFGLAVVLLVALRAIDYDDGLGEAQTAFRYLQGLLQRLEPYRAEAVAAGWDIDTTDLVIYPRLLGLEPQHRCHGTELRIFVYSIADMTRGPLHCQHGQWGLEALIPQWIRQGSCWTEDPEEADFFLVPWHTWCDRMVYRMNQTQREISKVYIDLMARREELLPHWSRRNGADHIFLFSDQGMNFFPEYRDYIPHSIFLVTEALTPECGPSCFSPWKDVVLPGHTDYFRYRRMRELNRPSGERSILFNFHGRYPGLCHLYRDNAVRGKIMEVFFGKPRVSVGGFVEDYFARMGLSHFCLVPMGTSSWTNHLYEAFFAGCIPVILSDGFRVPFEDILDWPAFSVKWPATNISMELYHFLDSIAPEELERMKALVDAHACWFDYHLMLEPPDGACSPYLGLLRGLERRRAQLRRGAAGAFWQEVHFSQGAAPCHAYGPTLRWRARSPQWWARSSLPLQIRVGRGMDTASERAVVAAMLAQDHRRVTEIAVLEAKLQETRRRHAEELLRLGAGSITMPAPRATASITMPAPRAIPAGARFPLDARGPFGTAQGSAGTELPLGGTGDGRLAAALAGQRGGVPAGSSSAYAGGPVLAYRRRDMGQRTFRLWVEDRPAAQGARVYAMDESTGRRTCSDVSDASLSSMLASFRCSQGREACTESQADVDDFLHALLGGVRFVASASGAGLQMQVPAEVSASRPPATSSSYEGSGATISSSEERGRTSACGPPAPGAQPASGLRRPDGLSQPERPRLVPSLGIDGPSQKVVPGQRAVPDVASPTGPAVSQGPTLHGVPCLHHGGPRSDYATTQACSPETLAEKLTTEPARPSGRPSGRPCYSAVAASKSVHRRTVSRPQSAPNSAKRPQSARPAGRDADRNCRVEASALRKMPEERRVSMIVAALDGRASRRTRPVSAKAMKHRRVFDDGNDSIIYEDIEEEMEEASEQGEVISTEACDYGRHAADKAHSGTGGCGSGSSSAHGSLSSRSVSQSRTPSAPPAAQADQYLQVPVASTSLLERTNKDLPSATTDADVSLDRQAQADVATSDVVDSAAQDPDSGWRGRDTRCYSDDTAVEPTSSLTEEPSSTAAEEPTSTAAEEPTSAASEEPASTPAEEPTPTAAEEPASAPTEEPLGFTAVTSSPAPKALEEPGASLLEVAADASVEVSRQPCILTGRCFPKPPPLEDKRPSARSSGRPRVLQVIGDPCFGPDAGAGQEASPSMPSVARAGEQHVAVSAVLAPLPSKRGMEQTLRQSDRSSALPAELGEPLPGASMLGHGPRASSPPPRGTARNGVL